MLKKNKNKTNTIGIRFSDDELETIETYCEKNRFVVGPFIRKTTLDLIDVEEKSKNGN